MPAPEYLDANDEHCTAFVDSILPYTRTTNRQRPWVTATWAQSLDGRVAALPEQPRLMISGQESMQMTFRLRARHDAILVSHATLAADNSQLSVRNIPEGQVQSQPVPIILDSKLQSPPSARLFQAARSPLIIYRALEGDTELTQRARVLHQLGARLVALPEEQHSLDSIFTRLKTDFDIQSILIEPGLSLIPTLLSSRKLIDMVVITTGSTLVGAKGRTPHWDGIEPTAEELEHVAATLVGKDVVTALRHAS